MRSDFPCAVLFLLAVAIAGCSGPSVRSEVEPLPPGAPLVEASDGRVSIALDALVTPNGPGSWARDARWDEYRFRIRAVAGNDVRITSVMIIDALGHSMPARADRAELEEATQQLARRYEAAALATREGDDHRTLGGLVGSALGGSAVGAAMMGGGGAFVSAGAVAAAAATVAVGGFLAVAGVRKLLNNFEVARELGSRHTPMPTAVDAESVPVVAFFPVVPRPSGVQLTYVSGDAPHTLHLDTREALREAHGQREITP